MAKKMTMADIASLSGVGKSTVSRYFNGGYVKDETRAKIQKVIEEYNYTPNAFARLNAKQSNVIGVVVPTLNSKITSRVITSIDRYLREKGYTTLIQNSDHNIDQELQNIQRLIQLNVDGILISSIAITKDHKELLKKADLVLYVVDTSDPLTKDDEEIMQLIEGKQTIVLLNKADLEQVVTKENLKEKGFDQIVQISAKEQTGIEELYQLIQDIFFEGHVSFNDEIYLTNMRHKTEVSEALKSLSMVLQSIEDGMPEDFFSIDLLDAYEHLGFITGESVGEDLVNEIFAEFCMGK